ncbi:hypothetical protein CP981_04460 [Streptomyces platensis]|uniref:Uncharacterized protein n=1 Tax=Streptomyces platensis TaxID=58346 RepID=A0AAE6NE54_STRPT|nr:hypothetical protein [Streptomyces platensis]OSY47103.1 hypothetical protein BG653_01531 [Streptomyces platensis]QEV51027.1 hypothetical protein CP981_04460 [Streptomyces platensis]BCK72996.1 hypothetical protein Srufu_069490 [Streptomyces libani subsp. rufus]
MSDVELTATEAARWALRAGLPLESERHAEVAATANHIHAVVRTLRELDFGETPPATHTVEAEATDGSL